MYLGFAACTAFLRSARSWSSDSSTPGARSFFTWSAATGILFAAGLLGLGAALASAAATRLPQRTRPTERCVPTRRARLCRAWACSAPPGHCQSSGAAQGQQPEGIPEHPAPFPAPILPRHPVSSSRVGSADGWFYRARSSELCCPHNTERSQTRSWGRYGTCGGLQVGQGPFALLASHGCRSRSAPKDAAEVQQP